MITYQVTRPWSYCRPPAGGRQYNHVMGWVVLGSVCVYVIHNNVSMYFTATGLGRGTHRDVNLITLRYGT